MHVDSKEVLAKLQSEPAPVTWAKLKKAFGVKKTGVTEADLRAALAGDGIFPWSKPKNSYWHVDPAAWLEAEILKLCGSKAQAKVTVKAAGKKETDDAVARLVAAKKIVPYPAVEGKKKVLVAALGGGHDAYWAYVRETIAEKLKKAGISEVGLEEKIWEVLPKLEPEKDVPVSTARVRRSLGLTDVDKKRFDEAALRLREQRKIYLSQHDHPLGLSAEDRDLLIDGKDGRYYVAIARREQ
jgi:hypothetical protein